MAGTKDIILDINPQPKQAAFMKSTSRYTLYGGARGGGKIVANESFVLTPFGFKSGLDLRVGDLINNPDGTVQRIIQIKPEVELERWTVVFSDGTKLPVAKDHLWKAWKANKTRKPSAEIVETRMLREWLDRGYTPQIPTPQAQPFNRTTKGKMMNPYVLGMLLGDGCLTGRNIQLACSEEDKPHYIEVLKGYDITTTTHASIAFTKESQQEMKRFFTKYNLIDKYSDTKFIPEYYKYSSIENRLGVVRGLMDTDGYNAPDKGACYYYSVSIQLADDMAFILRSLGALVTITDKIGSYRDPDGKKIVCKKCYCLYIRYKNADNLFLLKRKHHGKKCQTVNKRVVDIIVGGTVKGRCITVSNPNGLYITDDFIVTHNSWSARMKLELLCLKYPGIQCCLARRIRKDLYTNHMTDMIKDLENAGLAKWKDSQSAFIFTQTKNSMGVPSRIMFEFCDSERDLGKFQGPAYDVMSVEEATQFTPAMIDALKQANRPSGFVEDEDFKPRMYFTANPGGPGHAEIKRLFIDKNYRQTERESDYTFFPATIYDNQILMDRDPDYVRVLENLPPAKKRAMLYGDWNAYEGQFFENFTDNPEGYDSRILTHVINPFEIPASWPRYMGYDYGSRRPFSMHWYAVSGDGRLYCYKEYYGCDPDYYNVGKAMTIVEQAKVVKEMESDETAGGIRVTRMADPAIFAKDTTRIGEGESIADMFLQAGVLFQKAANTRIPGWEQLGERMRFDEDGRPMVYFFRQCRDMIRTIPLMMSDVHRPDDIDTTLEDHAVDECRYVCNTTRMNIQTRIKKRAHMDYEQARQNVAEKMECPALIIQPRGSYYGH